MFHRLFHRVLIHMLTLALIALTAAGCSQSPTSVEDGVSTQHIRYNVGVEPESLDPAIATGQPEQTILTALLEGLTRYDEHCNLQPALAKEWEISPDGLTYTFKLRDARWSNGEPITAGDVVFSWLRVLDPETASEYAYQLYYIKGAEEYNQGEASREDVAVRALDDKTLEVKLVAPAPQFLGLTAFQTLYPVNPGAVQNENWATSPETYVSSGPFKMVNWEPYQKISCVKNPDYWDADSVTLEKLDFYLLDSASTGFNMYQAGRIDFQDDVPTQEIASLNEDDGLLVFPDASNYFYRFNVTREPLDDPRVRRALTMAIDRTALVDSITQAGERPAYAFVPFGFKDADGRDFREVGGDYFSENLEEARRLLSEAGYPSGEGFPELSIMYNNNREIHGRIAQAIQQMWKQNLGIDVALEPKEWQVYLDAESRLDYDIARAGWSPDYLDPMTFLEMFVTDCGNNNTGWSNTGYDDLIRQANVTADRQSRMEAMRDAEKILMTELPIMPVFFDTNPNLIKNNVKGVVVLPFGPLADFRWAYCE